MSNINIRNFCIIAHIDHGKSTLAARILEYTKVVKNKNKIHQILDAMELEQERGITIKAKTVRMDYIDINHKRYIFNLIDTPGHVDFSYEVHRALVACEGAILVIDATQGVESQTIANTLLAKKAGLYIIPVINKIDLLNADTTRTIEQIKHDLKIYTNPILVSAKKNIGINKIIDSIIINIPQPKIILKTSLSAIIFDSFYDQYRGAILLIRVFQGCITKNMKITLISSKIDYKVLEVGYIQLTMIESSFICSGEVGYIITGIGLKDIHNIKIGDTITESKNKTQTIRDIDNNCQISNKITPFLFAGVYSNNVSEYKNLQVALDKLQLSDSSFSYTTDSSKFLGLGFRCGFLGSLHLEIVKERLEREFGLSIFITFPSVLYKIQYNNNVCTINSPSKWPNNIKIDKILEPYVEMTIKTPVRYLGVIFELCKNKRGIQKELKYINSLNIMLKYVMPLSEIIVNFHTILKSLSSGYASFTYQHIGFKCSNLVKLEILINAVVIDTLTTIVHINKAYSTAHSLVNKLKSLIPQQLFEIPIQAKINNRIIARANISALRKDVLAKCYGGDISRKRKLLEKQKAGKHKMKKFGKVNIPSETFINLFKIT
ncbi:MAG: translation elongation factor 4 [Endomicrobium sp.]|jgi:GTP-binding protein LepA|nr:translation elongation factor 4 [Endomicrobium sp.]